VSLRKENKVLVLLGAGASYEAEIPTSPVMIDKLEDLLKDQPVWNGYQSLYHFVKSAIYFADGIGGKFNSEVNYNIERLVNTLSELDKKVKHPLYPFIGNWNIKLTELGGEDFKKIRELRQMILKELQDDWVLLSDYSKSHYYRGLFEFAKDFQYPLRVFSLNYDLCVEKNCKDEILERGFRDGRTWDWRNFEPTEGETPNIFLYKLHGSIDWLRDKHKNLTFSDEASKIKTDQLEIIFGTDYKLQYTDPFLFFVYEFRRWTLEAKLIIAIGYGFADEHINGILGQALESAVDPDERKLLAVAPFSREEETAAITRLMETLRITRKEQIVIKKMNAGDFMYGEMTIDKLNEYFPEGEDVFEEVA
jgi:hypothetical protein